MGNVESSSVSEQPLNRVPRWLTIDLVVIFISLVIIMIGLGIGIAP
jgi:hypothetical protein